MLLIFITFLTHSTWASHLRAGEIIARRVSTTSLMYEVTLTAYYDLENGRPAADAADIALFYIGGVGPINVQRKQPITNSGNNTSRNEYTLLYTFPSPGTFTVSTALQFRNNEILNIGPPPTFSIDFFLRSTLVINANLGLNRTPVLLNPPIDLASVGERYIHNPGAFDADGDSLSYQIVTPQRSSTPGLGRDVQYVDPNQVQPVGPKEDGTFPSTFSINAINGNLI